MTTTLQEVIAAARAGDPEHAQLLAAEYAQSNPDDPNGWYLLSQLVDSDARRAAYLGKTLALDPNHPRALAEFAALPPGLAGDLAAPVTPTAVMDAPVEPVADELAIEHSPVVEAPALEPAAIGISEEDTPTGTIVTAADAPDWLQPLSPEPVAATTTAASTTTTTAPAPRPRPTAAPPTKKRNGGNQALSILLALLALLTLLVLVFLAYLLFF